VNANYYEFYEDEILAQKVQTLEFQPKISILMPIYNINKRKRYILEALSSLFNQSYKNWELCIAVRSDESSIIDNIIFQNKLKTNIIVCENTAKKSQLIDTALNMSSGKYIALLEQEDRLSKNALAYIIEALNENNKLKVIYTDENRFIKKDSFFNPLYKKDIELKEKFSERLLIRLGVFEKKLITSLGNYSLKTLRKIIDLVDPCFIKHIPKTAYHYRTVENIWNNPNKVKPIAFYLPQYHITPENNLWWGDGFTEWSNVKKTTPLFKGHYQQRIPNELGYYDLVEDKSIQKKQIQLAKEYGLYGFCYYYYWFDEKRLLRKPLDQVVNNKELDFPFCICWSNGNWTRKWDGLDEDILCKQIHTKEYDRKFIYDVIPMFKDERYIKIKGAPFLIIYQIYLFEDPVNTIKEWKNICKSYGFKDLHVAIVKQNEAVSPVPYGADSLVEFPPHLITAKNITEEVEDLNKNFKGNIYSYKSVVNSINRIKKEKYTFFRGCMLHWDNTARRNEHAHIFHDFSLESYKDWLLQCIDYAKTFNSEEEQIIFINAWNEWAEGTYLEPDKKYDRKYLEATREVLDYR
jgi:glycosyltransferase involved in cell wall biosynthesis